MEDNSFLYFTQDEILEKIDIDPRLADSFKRVMSKMQEYYNANGYTSQRNFKDYIEEYLLNSGDNNLRIYINKIDIPGVKGFYIKSKNEICINEDCLKERIEKLDSTLCHEFTHFLVMHSLKKDKSDPQIYNGGFVNEALTEMMTQQMYPNSNAYDAQVAMHKYANLLSGKVNNYSMFLNGQVDARYSSHDWLNYMSATEQFQNDFNEVGYINLVSARSNKNFIKAQRYLIDLYIRPKNVKTFDEYCEAISKLMDRPVQDQEYIDKVISDMDMTMINSLKINNPQINEVLEKKLEEARELIKKSKMYSGEKVYELEFEGKKYILDENLDLRGRTVGIQWGWNPQTRIFSVQSKNSKMEIKYDDIDFNKFEVDIRKKLDELALYYSKDYVKNLAMTKKAVEQSGNLIKIEKFTLPSVGVDTKKRIHTVYIATYDDKVVVLNDCSEIEKVSNIPLYRYIGMTSKTKNAAIYQEELGNIENGVMYSGLTQKQITNNAVYEYLKEIEKTIKRDKLEQIIEEYKKSEYYMESESEEEEKDEALLYFAKKEFASLTEEEKNKYIKTVKQQGEKFIVTVKNGIVDVATLNSIISAYNAERQVLYDLNGIGAYNDICNILMSNQNSKKNDDRQSIRLDSNGNIFEEKKENVMEKTYEQKLKEVNVKLGELRSNYGVLARQLEELMNKNQQSPISDYESQKDKLMQQMNEINEQISKEMPNQKSLQNLVDAQKEEEHNNTIHQVERILGVEITNTDHYVTGTNGVPRIVCKNISTLHTEQGEIYKKLQEIYNRGEIDFKTYRNMVSEVVKEYDSFRAETKKMDKMNKVNNAKQTKNDNPNDIRKPVVEHVEPLDKKKNGVEKTAIDELRKMRNQYLESVFKKNGDIEDVDTTDKENVEGHRRLI